MLLIAVRLLLLLGLARVLALPARDSQPVQVVFVAARLVQLLDGTRVGAPVWAARGPVALAGAALKAGLAVRLGGDGGRCGGRGR